MIYNAESSNTGMVSFRDSQNATEFIGYESFGDIRAATAREKQVEHWGRQKRLALIDAQNPTWKDLTEFLFPRLKSSEQILLRIVRAHLPVEVVEARIGGRGI
jgi:hypothetical protein